MSHITTYQKRRFDPTVATADDVDIRDIAHALSLLCRANGHFAQFYSVAQHSLNCAAEAKCRGYSERVQLGCLLHDASEAFLSDVTRPVKAYLPQYIEIEEKLQTLIFDKWIAPPLTDEEKTLIFDIDDTMLYHEFLNLMGEVISETTPFLVSSPIFTLEDFATVERRFLEQFQLLNKE